MAPIPVHQHQPRSVNKGLVMTICFTLIASFALLSVFIWAFLIPFLRKKYFPPKPSQTKFNHSTKPTDDPSTELTQDRNRKRLLAEAARTSSHAPAFNPRLHTPLSRVFSEPENIPLPMYTPRRNNTSAMDTDTANHGLFTPVHDRFLSYPQPVTPKSYTLPRVRDRFEQRKPTSGDRDFGDAKEYILALPEPLRVRSRTQGEHLATSSTLDTLPDSDRQFALADKHPHPKKLFEALSRQNIWDNQYSNTNLRAGLQLPNNAAVGETDVGYDGSVESGSEVSRQAREQMPKEDKAEPRRSRTPISSMSSEDKEAMPQALVDRESESESDSSPHNPSIAAMHRLRTYRSLVGAPPPEPLSRAGTLTRPKTPVAAMRDIYDRKTGDSKITRETVSRNDTISTLFRTVVTGSDCHSSQSSATSPQKSSPAKPFTASTLSLLPTPLSINRSFECRSVSTPVRCGSEFKDELKHNYEAQQPITNSICNALKEEVNLNQASTLPTMAGRPKPAPLKLATSARLPNLQNKHRRTNEPACVKGTRSKRYPIPSMQASSVYSRNTQGLSVAYTPETPDFPAAGLYCPPFSPFIPSSSGNITESDKGTEVHLIKHKNSPVVDTAKTKVENWHVDTSGLEFDTSPSPSLKRALSTLGPECQSTHEVLESDGEDTLSAISTDIHPSEARLSSVVGSPLRVSVCADVAVRASGLAPGGAEWI